MIDSVVQRIISHSTVSNKLQPWIIVGPQSINKTHTAYKIAEELLAYNIGKAQSKTLISNGSHPDFLVIGNVEGKTIGVEEVRKAQEFLRQKPILSEYKVCIIDSMDRVSNQAANSLLKAIEEPHSKTLILLITTSIGNIIPTIKSRCMSTTVPQVSIDKAKAYIKEILVDKTESDISNAITIAEGDASKALLMLQNQVLDWYIKFLENSDSMLEIKDSNIVLYFDCLYRFSVILLHFTHNTLNREGLLKQETEYITKLNGKISSTQALNILDKVMQYKTYANQGTGSSKYMLQDLFTIIKEV